MGTKQYSVGFVKYCQSSSRDRSWHELLSCEVLSVLSCEVLSLLSCEVLSVLSCEVLSVFQSVQKQA